MIIGRVSAGLILAFLRCLIEQFPEAGHVEINKQMTVIYAVQVNL